MDSIQLDPGARPLDHTRLAPQSAYDNLARKLETQYGLSPEYAAIAARMWTDPSDIRHRLDRPVRKPFPGGEILFVEGLAFSAAIGASPWNPREFQHQVYPIAQHGSSQTAWRPMTLRDPHGERAGQPVLVVSGKSPQQVADRLRSSEARLRTNSQWTESLHQFGVLEPVTAILCEIEHDDGSPARIAVVTDDGSTRISEAHYATQVDAAEVIYDLPDLDLRAWRGLLGNMIAAQDRSVDQITTTEAVAHRLTVVPARLIIAVKPWRDRDAASVVMAHHAITGAIHLDPPAEWPKGSQMDEVANAVIDSLRTAGIISKDSLLDYVHGVISGGELKQHGFSHWPDVRQATICSLLFKSANNAAVSAGVRAMVQKKKLYHMDKPNLATELVLRSVRRMPSGQNQTEERRIEALRSALQRTLNLAAWRNRPWSADSHRSSEELRDAALAEHAEGRIDGPAQLELGMLAAYWLVMSGTLRRDSRKTDGRSGGSVIQAMLSSARGIHQLYQAIMDGRAGFDHGTALSAIRVREVVDEEGQLVRFAGGGYKVISEDKELRALYPSEDESGSDPDAASDIVNTQPPEVQLEQGLSLLEKFSTRIEEVVQQINQIRDADGQVLVKQGVPDTRTEPITARLRAAVKKLDGWSSLHEMLSSVDEAEEEDE